MGEYRYFPVFRIGVEILYNFAKIFVTFVTAVVLCPSFSVVVCFGKLVRQLIMIMISAYLLDNLQDPHSSTSSASLMILSCTTS